MSAAKWVSQKMAWTAALLLIIIGAFVVYVLNSSSQHLYVAKVNNEAITQAEFKLILSASRAAVFQDFRERYDAEYSDDFWNQAFNGEVPIESLRKAVLQQIVSNRVMLKEGTERGIMASFSYRGMLKAYEADQTKRPIKTHSFGAEQSAVYDYYQYMLSSLETKLRDDYMQNEITEFKLKELYDQNKEAAFKKAGTTRILEVTIPYNDNDKAVKTSRLQKVIVKIKNGVKFEQAAKEQGLQVIAQTFNEQTAKQDGIVNRKMFAAAMKLDKHQLSEIVEEHNQLTVIQCVDKYGQSYMSFTEALPSLKLGYAKEELAKQLADKLAKAKVEINSAVYDQIN